MKISVDDELLLELSPLDIKIMENDIPAEKILDEVKRRIIWVIKETKIDQCYERINREWKDKLLQRGIMPSFEKHIFVSQVFSQQDYKNRDQRDLEQAVNLGLKNPDGSIKSPFGEKVVAEENLTSPIFEQPIVSEPVAPSQVDPEPTVAAAVEPTIDVAPEAIIEPVPEEPAVKPEESTNFVAG